MDIIIKKTLFKITIFLDKYNHGYADIIHVLVIKIDLLGEEIGEDSIPYCLGVFKVELTEEQATNPSSNLRISGCIWDIKGYIRKIWGSTFRVFKC